MDFLGRDFCPQPARGCNGTNPLEDCPRQAISSPFILKTATLKFREVLLPGELKFSVCTLGDHCASLSAVAAPFVSLSPKTVDLGQYGLLGSARDVFVFGRWFFSPFSKGGGGGKGGVRASSVTSPCVI